VLLQCVVAVCDAVLLQCVAVEQQLNRTRARILMCRGRVRLQCVAACCSVLQRVAAWRAPRHVAVCCSVLLQCVIAVRCSVACLQSHAATHGLRARILRC